MRRHRLAAIALASCLVGAGPASAAIHCVNTGGTGGCFASIQAAINAASNGDTINVAAGTYVETVTLNKDLTLNGAQAGVDACGRSASESILSGPATPGVFLLTLITGSAGSTIDGFTFSGGDQGLRSSTGPITGLQILNNRFLLFSGSGVFLNDNGENITAHQNSVDGSAKVTSGDLFHLDTDNFDGFHFTSNCVFNGATATGFFVDGNENVGPSTLRPPLFDDNLIADNNTGVNLGSRAFDGGVIGGVRQGLISDSTFLSNNFDGLQGGIQNTSITRNSFLENGRHGLALTSFGNLALDRGAQNSAITQNCFNGNGFTNAGAGLFFSATQGAGTISTNFANDNDIQGNATGAQYTGVETIDVEDNWWGHPTGPFAPTNPTGMGDSAVGTGLDFVPWRTASQGLCPNSPPEPSCNNPTVGTDSGECTADVPCETIASCDDPDGDQTTVTCEPEGPYPLGTTTVEVTCDDGNGGVTTIECTVTVVDDDPPAAGCDQGTNPGCRTGSHGSGRGNAGFVTVQCGDNCAPGQAYITSDDPDDCGQVPVQDGETVKITRSNGHDCTREVNTTGGACPVRHIQTAGDPVLVCTDAAGNVTSVSCLNE